MSTYDEWVDMIAKHMFEDVRTDSLRLRLAEEHVAVCSDCQESLVELYSLASGKGPSDSQSDPSTSDQ